MNWIKNNLLQMAILAVLVYVLIQISILKADLDEIKIISKKTAKETELNNFKLDYVESDINSKFADSVDESAKNKQKK